MKSLFLFIIASVAYLATSIAQTPDTMWTKTYGFRPSKDYWDEGRFVEQTIDGGYIIAGYSDTYCMSWYYADICLIKTDEDGNEQWRKIYGLILVRY